MRKKQPCANQGFSFSFDTNRCVTSCSVTPSIICSKVPLKYSSGGFTWWREPGLMEATAFLSFTVIFWSSVKKWRSDHRTTRSEICAVSLLRSFLSLCRSSFFWLKECKKFQLHHFSLFQVCLCVSHEVSLFVSMAYGFPSLIEISLLFIF